MKKKFLLSAVMLCFLIAGSVKAQVQGNVIKFNIFSPIVKTINFSYEKTVSATSSAQLGVAITSIKITDTKFSGFQLTPEYRFYLSETEAPEGFFAAPFVRYSSFSLTNEFTSSEADMTTFGGGLILGKQWLLGGNDNISMDLFIGPNYASSSVTVKSGANDFSLGGFDGFGIRWGLNFGFAF